MIHADLHGKTGVPEDVLTSCCLGLLRLLPDALVLDAFSMANNSQSKIDLAGVDGISDIEFWPWLHGGGQPDVLVSATATTPPRQLKIVVEVKHGSGKSGGDKDQLARYFDATRQQYPEHEIALIYLTHHRDLPAAELKASASHLEHPADASSIYWLSWYSMAQWCLRKQQEGGVTATESRILAALAGYLGIKGYQRYERWRSLATQARLQPVYAKTYGTDPGAASAVREPIYSRFYARLVPLPRIFASYAPPQGTQ